MNENSPDSQPGHLPWVDDAKLLGLPATRTGSLYFRYQGQSMWPAFQPGDLLVVTPTPPEKLRQGDCVIYQMAHRSEYTVHRIVATKPQIWTQGDARPARDDHPVLPDWIVGRVQTRIRWGRSETMKGGFAGSGASRIYRFLHRFDPARQGKGGDLARICQRTLGAFVGPTVWHGHVANFRPQDQPPQTYLMLRGRVIGRFDTNHQEWVIVWPHSLWVNPKTVHA